MNSIRFDHPKPDRVDHHTPESHWCGACRHWVVDCDHVVSPLPITQVEVDDGWMRSLSYDRLRGRLEIEFRWNDVRQFWPVSPAVFKELWRDTPRYLVLHQKIIGDRRMRWFFVRTEGKVLVSMLWALPRFVR